MLLPKPLLRPSISIDLAADRLDVLFVEVGDRAVIGEIFVVARKEEDEIAGRADIEPLQELRPLRADAANKLDRRAKHFGRRGLSAWRRLLAGASR